MSEGADRRRGWGIVAILCGLYVFSMVDRMMPALLVEGLRADLEVTPLQFGLLIGTGFGLLYSLAGIPIAYWIDRGNRKWIVFAGVMLWSIATIASALAGNYTQLLFARAGVALGEAVLIPGAMSMIGDLFVGRSRARATSVFAATGQIMGSALFLAGAGALAVAAVLAPAYDLPDWRVAFLVVGIPPALLGLAWLWIAREPARSNDEPTEVTSNAAAIRYLGKHRRLFGGMYLAVGLTSMMVFGALAWLPTLLQQLGLTPARAGAAIGLAGLLPTIAGAALSPAAAAWLERRGFRNTPLKVGGAMLALGTFVLAATVGSDDPMIVIIGSGCATFGFAGFYITPMLVIQSVAPARMRARLTALNQFSVNAIGLGLGPPAVALIGWRFAGGDAMLGWSLTVVAIAAGSLAVIAALVASEGYAKASRYLAGAKAGSAALGGSLTVRSAPS